MKIGIDIDDVITDTSGALKQYIDKYDEDSDVHKYIEDILRGDMPTDEIKLFFKKYAIKAFSTAKIKENAINVLSELMNDGHEIYLITTRGETRMKGSEEITLKYLKDKNINYTKLLFNSFNKVQVCKENNIEILVDDSVKYCNEAQNNNIKSILFTSVVNTSIYTTTPRVNNWIELKEKVYELINKK